ncbi:MAG TPA: hypothetical protein VGH10_03310 [Actinomycetota bacterium]|jgi:hypothetical protein
MAGWGDDPVMAELQSALDEGWQIARISEDRSAGESFDVVTVEKDGESKEFRSDHLAFHRYVEGLMDDMGLSYS